MFYKKLCLCIKKKEKKGKFKMVKGLQKLK